MEKNAIIRTVVLFIALVNQALATFGASPLPFSDDLVYEIVSIVVTIGAAVLTWWKDTPVTTAAKIGHTITRAIKDGKLSAEKLQLVIDKFNETN